MSSPEKSSFSKGSKRMFSSTKDFTPIKWSRYFDNKKSVSVNGSTFNVYIKGDSGPVIIALHSGGYSGLTWALFAEQITTKITCRVVAIDLRGHGLTKTLEDENLDLSLLANDVKDVASILVDDGTSIILIGHSVGRAVAASLQIKNTVALGVIDVVEGTALESMPAMKGVLQRRPICFQSLEHAIQWCVRSGQTRNLEAARVSMPSQLKNIKTGMLGTLDINEAISALGECSEPPVKLIHQQPADSMAKVEENESASNSSETASKQEEEEKETNLYTWRIDLNKTERFWNGWFKGLSQKFLNLVIPKVLLLGDIHDLDAALTYGEMQGKFQMHVMHKSGHIIHEDQPAKVADIIAGFLVKHKLAKAKEGFIAPVMVPC